MNGSARRFGSPVDVPRPRGARLLEAFSPKLGRRVRLFDHAAFEQWIQLEADPGDGGVPIQVVQNNLGHASIGTTSGYLTTERDARLAAMKGFGEKVRL